MERASFDTIVVGGGLAGICAAMAAARCGVKVALIHDRPLLGGNASGELRVGIAGADCSGSAIARYVRETGIIDELRIENLQRNPANSADVLSLVLREAVEAEPGLTLFMNTRVRAVNMASRDRIDSVEADQLTTEKRFLFHAQVFIDCTGDGFVGAAAGASFRVGREARARHGESLAPETADHKVLPSCVEFHLKDMGRPTPFRPPTWACRYESDDDLPFRSTAREAWEFGGMQGGFWWLSSGGDRSTTTGNEETYAELLPVVMGVWDHMKNHGDHGAENFALNWISPITGKRESRRLEGDHWLSENDVLNAPLFADRVAYGGWSIDLHPAEGVFSKDPPNLHIPLPRPYSIPLACLYSKNITNLLMAGRDASFTHVGLGSPRVIATCGAAGQAAGVAAGICVGQGCAPRDVRVHHAEQVQQTLLRQGASVLGCANRDPDDLARAARVTASSESALCVADTPDSGVACDHRLFQLFPLSGDRLDAVDVLIEAGQPCRLVAGLRRSADIWDFSSADDLAVTEAAATEAGQQWVRLPFGRQGLERGLYWLWIDAEPSRDVRWLGATDAPVGVVRGVWQPPEYCESALAPPYRTMRGAFIFRLSPASNPYEASNVTNGVARPGQWPNLWVSRAVGDRAEWLELSWPEAQPLGEVHLAFDGQFDSNVTWPPPLGVFGCEAIPSIVKHYDIRARHKGGWRTVADVRDNYRQRRIHAFERVVTDTIRISVHETNGVPEARVFEVRAYGTDTPSAPRRIQA